MTIEGLAWLVLASGVLQLAALALLGLSIARSRRDLDRLIRAVAGLVYQESDRTRARLDELFRPSR